MRSLALTLLDENVKISEMVVEKTVRFYLAVSAYTTSALLPFCTLSNPSIVSIPNASHCRQVYFRKAEIASASRASSPQQPVYSKTMLTFLHSCICRAR
jgi:hypothetical protein